MAGAAPDLAWAAAALPQTQALAAALLLSEPSLAISVWHPRADPGQRLGSKLKTCNQAFRDLCDAVHFGDGSPHLVLVVNPLVICPDTAALLRASVARVIEMVDALHSGEATHVRSHILHLSRLGRQKKVRVDVIAVHVNGALAEWVCTETLLPDSFEIPRDLLLTARAFEIISKTVASPSPPPSPHAEAEVQKAGMFSQWVHTRYGIKTAKWTVQIASANKKRRIFYDGKWACVQCHARETTQRRRGPGGPLTLCNRCGLRFLKAEQSFDGPAVVSVAN